MEELRNTISEKVHEIKEHKENIEELEKRIDEEKVEKASLDQNTSTLKKNLSL